MKKTIITIVIAIIAVIIVYLVVKSPSQNVPVSETTIDSSSSTGVNGSNTAANSGATTGTGAQSSATSSQSSIPASGSVSAIGTSVAGREIDAYHFGTGSKEVLFVGGIHGGYEWNTVLVAYELASYLKSNPSVIPAGVRVTVIPVLNPDGLYEVVGTTSANFTAANVSKSTATVIAGRFNGNNVDLNRNFDCDWASTGKWQSRTVNGGTAAFSEPESQAIKSYVEANKPVAVVVWYSAAGGVYASDCHVGVSTVTDALTKAYAKAAGYTANQSFDDYATTGDMTNWLAKIGTPAISVLLTNHSDVEWSKNLAGIKAVLNQIR